MAVSWPVELMVARPVSAIPTGDRMRHEPKLDGFRVAAFRRGDGRVVLQSRRLRSLTAAFPDVVDTVAEAVPPGTVLDGEVVVMVGERVDFAALQRRLTSGTVRAPATFIAFDALAVRGEDLRPLAAGQRREALRALIPASRTGLGLVPVTGDAAAAAAWLNLGSWGIEGTVSKDITRAYLPRRYHWVKCRARRTSEAVVGGVVGALAAPRALLLGRYDQRGRLRVVARSVPLGHPVRGECAARLRLPTAEHPWPATLPGSWVGLAGSPPVRYAPVAPTLVVEIDTDGAVEHGRFRHHVRVVRPRFDLLPEDLPPWTSPETRTPG